MGAQDQAGFHKGILEKYGELCEFTRAPCTGLCKSSNFSTYAVIPALSMLRLILRWEEILISSQFLFLTFLVHIDVHITMHLTEKE